MPKLQKLAGDLQKHLNLTDYISTIVEDKKLLEVSKLEQEIACSNKRKEHFRAVNEFINDDEIGAMEKLRLTALYALRYEADSKVN